MCIHHISAIGVLAMDEDNLLQFLNYFQVLGLGLYAIWKRNKRKRWINRRWWVRPINERRGQNGDFATLFAELKEDPDLFFRYTRMDVDTFYELLDMVRPYLQKTSLRKPICPEQRLAITLRYLATGDQVLSVALAYRIGESTAYKIIKETCEVIANILLGVYIKVPSEDEWKHISRNF
ncbi:PREDICTED: uncharacterized protein LOC105565748 [Vollenhovia emeryi]|uniref:uncharacterized protein LOC105565748 n=1 Tax=Vollenhovia emeryi TaxID=411798 RepID=UPI0005F4613C|nr:PREDICTED: uncharacterized protein LOC105565748 [Vollenhovia emeryi]